MDPKDIMNLRESIAVKQREALAQRAQLEENLNKLNVVIVEFSGALKALDQLLISEQPDKGA